MTAINRSESRRSDSGRLPESAHASQPWLIHQIAPDFRLLDVWALPIPGGADDFPRLVRQIATGDVPNEAGGYRGQLAVLVKPNGLLGAAYLTAISPFRHLIVYPALIKAIGQSWRAG